ncbi:MAG TPA: hypothetical protein VKU61_14780 [Candidatus Binatia bacterium]|nr:hypothetical protein [Candidatus Binatia bacterium]
MIVRTVAAVLGGMALAVGFVTLVALEPREVVVVRTVDDAGERRDTRTWIADDAGFAWIEAANPERPFLRHLTARPDIELIRAGHVRRCRAQAMPNPDGHARVRELLARRYGWADCWIGMLTDTSRSVAVRLACA